MVDKKYRVVTPRRVQAQIKKHFDHIRTESPQNAVAVRKRIYEMIRSLDHFPYRFSKYPHINWESDRLRSVPVWDYIIVYFIEEEKSRVTVVRVYQGAEET